MKASMPSQTKNARNHSAIEMANLHLGLQPQTHYILGINPKNNPVTERESSQRLQQDEDRRVRRISIFRKLHTDVVPEARG